MIANFHDVLFNLLQQALNQFITDVSHYADFADDLAVIIGRFIEKVSCDLVRRISTAMKTLVIYAPVTVCRTSN